MKAFLYIRLLSDGETIVYGNPVLDQVKKLSPDVALLDLDSRSEQLVLHYAKQLLHEATQTIVCIDSTTPDAGFGNVFPLLEQVLESENNQLILFRNSHHRLQRMVQARPELKAIVVQDNAALLQAVEQFYS
ncbi:hypothetical protein H7F15_02595 [Pontibacter sp. Tf4]|uniref:hypothetical protein n=1 Tax=Pontibacter sp. Tf4 TaxID=2761620 RepID=UPI00162782E9|nr:hypothetical protein [Pontibacter sp. Tf4]MBB6609915.1 hypothetical protein [Pontibacter sp. Tf4]